MARPGRPERNRATQSFRQLRRFHHVINSDEVFGTHRSHILTFAGYNAGRGSVRDWVKVCGDPRDPKVDPVDWVKRIPFSETRNCVLRVIENLAVYRVRFESGPAVAKTDQPVALQERTNVSPLPSTKAAAGR